MVVGTLPKLTLEAVATAFGAGSLKRRAETDTATFSSITTDSRAVVAGALFAAIKGDRFDGHHFIRQAVEAGATGVLAERGSLGTELLEWLTRPEAHDVSIFEVDHTIDALRRLAGWIRQQFHGPVVGIGGAVGKTTTKELTAAFLGASFSHVARTQGSQNGFLGIPLTVFGWTSQTDAAVVEIGIDDRDAMRRHADLVKPDIAIVTRIAPEHLEQLGTLAQVAYEETELLRETLARGGRVALFWDDPWLKKFHDTEIAPNTTWSRLTTRYSMIDTSVEFFGKRVESITGDPRLQIHAPTEGVLEVPLLLPGEHNVVNQLAAIVLTRLSGVERAGLQDWFRVHPKPSLALWGRSQILNDTVRKAHWVCDFYNANPESMRVAFQLTLEEWEKRGKTGRVFTVLGEMRELGPETRAYHATCGEHLAHTLAQLPPENRGAAFFYGSLMHQAAESVRKALPSMPVIENTENEKIEPLIEALMEWLGKDDIVLLKGSRGTQMERVWKAFNPETPPLLAPDMESQDRPDTARAVSELKAGHLVVVPTETVYGLGAWIGSEAGVLEIFRVKGRPFKDPLIVHIPPAWRTNLIDHLQRAKIVDGSSLEPARRSVFLTLASKFWPGPLSIVVRKHPDLSTWITAGMDTVAVRMPAHPLFGDLLDELDDGVAAPSANRFGSLSPTDVQAVRAELGDMITMLDGGPCGVGVESTVVRIESDGSLTILRQGGITEEELKHIAPTKSHMPADEKDGAQPSPGMLARHYSPRKPCVALADLKHFLDTHPRPIPWRVGLLTKTPWNADRKQVFERSMAPATFWIALSRTGDPNEAARQLYRRLRQLDLSSDCDLIAFEEWNEGVGLARALQDRLIRASSK